MLDMGFIHDVKKVIARLPEQRQTLLFSATMPQEIAELSKTILVNPVRVEVTPQSSTVDAIDQQLYKVDKANKKHLLQHVLQDPALDSVLVFTNMKHGADRVVKELGRRGISAMAIHGNKGQTARVKALESFKSGAIRVLVATDIAARGIDVNELSCVINYELPNVPETYVHRIGRTGRAGRSGIAISFCNFDELAYLKDIEKLIGKKIPVVDNHPWPMEIFEATPKAVRPPRPPRAERQKAADIAAGKGNQPSGNLSASKEPGNGKAPGRKDSPRPAISASPRPSVSPAEAQISTRRETPPPKASTASALQASEQRKAPSPPEPSVSVPQSPQIRRLSSDPRPIGRLMASADGRRKRRSKSGK